jgi:hypothetical protein
MNAQTLLHLLAPLLTPTVVAVLVGSQLLTIGMNWAASGLLGANEPTLRNAAKCWGFNILLGLVLAVGIGVLTVVMVSIGLSPLGLVIVAVPLAMVLAVAVPMNVYKFGTWRAVAFLLVLMVGNAGLSTAAGLLAPRTLDPKTLQALQTAARQAMPAGGVKTAPLPKGARSATLTQNVWLPVMIDGQKSGDVEVERGTQLEVVGEDGDQVRVKFLDAVVKVPRSKLAF